MKTRENQRKLQDIIGSVSMIFPNIDVKTDHENLAIQAFGKRLYADQTLIEYLLEFLMIFISEKQLVVDKNDNDSNYIYDIGFPEPNDLNLQRKKLQYSPQPRMGLKRFIFFERSKLENRFDVDIDAYKDIVGVLTKKINVDSDKLISSDVLAILQDLFYGFNSVIRNRSWFVQSLLPICPEVIFCESMGYKKDRVKIKYNLEDDTEKRKIDKIFDFNGHYFMARGGEVYFLHVIQGLISEPDLEKDIEEGIIRIISSYREFGQLANWIQRNWEQHINIKEDKVKKTCEWIPMGYARRAPYTCKELHIFLSTKLYPLQAMELLSCGVVLQILRMMHENAAVLIRGENHIPAWIIDVSGNHNANIRKHAVASYKECEEDLLSALNKYLINIDKINEEGKKRKKKTDIDLIKEGSNDAHKLFRRLAKELGLVVPPKGNYMRFSISERILKFLVMSLVPPGQKITLSSFLEKLYDHYRMIIGTKEMHKHCTYLGKNEVDYSYFDDNAVAFQELLKKCGFLRDLSDATSIVENPFGKV